MERPKVGSVGPDGNIVKGHAAPEVSIGSVGLDGEIVQGVAKPPYAEGQVIPGPDNTTRHVTSADVR